MYSYLILYPNRSRAAGGGGKSPPGPGRYHGYSKPVLLRDSAHPDNEHIDKLPYHVNDLLGFKSCKVDCQSTSFLQISLCKASWLVFNNC